MAAAIALRHTRAAFLLIAALVFSGCTESPDFVKAGGPFFAVAEKVPSSKARIYFYWPPEETSKWSSLRVHPCEAGGVEIHVGGYDSFLVEPGQQCLSGGWSWTMEAVDISGSTILEPMELNVEPGHTLYVRLEKARGLLRTMTLQPVEPAAAAREIRRCRQMIPLTRDEVARRFAEGE